MTSDQRRRILIAVEPRLLSDALTRILGDDYEVLDPDPATWTPADATGPRYDAAIVTEGSPAAQVRADLVLVLPPPDPASGVGVLHTPDGSRTVPVDGLAAIVDALEATPAG